MSSEYHQLVERLLKVSAPQFSALDALGEGSFAEKMVQLVLEGCPDNLPPLLHSQLTDCRRQLVDMDTSQARVVVFGGGTGLSSIIGGDSRLRTWWQQPFSGMKELFPRVHSVVCTTDDGGSTGELLKDLPLVGLGDLRHVLLACVRDQPLRDLYGLDRQQTVRTIKALHGIFNYRFISFPHSPKALCHDTGVELTDIPGELRTCLLGLIDKLFADPRLNPVLLRPQCLGNLLLAAAIFAHIDSAFTGKQLDDAPEVVAAATLQGVAELASRLGVPKNAVLPCTITVARLQLLYMNGVLATGEEKSSRAMRGVPVDRVWVEFFGTPDPHPAITALVEEADIIVLAPGSLYSSIIPIFQIPGIADAVRRNHRALKLLVANIWVQQGETDASRDAWERKFYVSDLILAYHRNIPGGIHDLFSHVLALNLRDIPGSVLQRYAIEQKEPIYLDRSRVAELGFETVQASVFAKDKLEKRLAIQHDPDNVARAVQVLWRLSQCGQLPQPQPTTALPEALVGELCKTSELMICQRYRAIRVQVEALTTEEVRSTSGKQVTMDDQQRRWLLERLVEIVWLHQDIPLEHLHSAKGVTIVSTESWRRCQQWDNVYSFYDPMDQHIKIRQDQVEDHDRLEMAFLVALGQSLLGNYAGKKEMVPLIEAGGEEVGLMYRLTVRDASAQRCYLSAEDIDRYLRLIRMHPMERQAGVYTRVVNFGEGFTPPGLFFGLFYAWYLDNRFAANIEYKMSIMQSKVTGLIPEEIRIARRRQRTITFFRSRVFRQVTFNEDLRGLSGETME
ncbi:MAG: hypothetical protein CSA34_06170 [Desulfobulbus propionicus]|nr:MAG: hypothetical protein CSA34_06170 [Desulfobulbus propionicus]